MQANSFLFQTFYSRSVACLKKSFFINFLEENMRRDCARRKQTTPKTRLLADK